MLAESLLLQLPQATRTRIWCRSEGSWIQLSTWRPLRERHSNCRAPTHLHSSTVSNHCIQKGIKSEWEKYWKLRKDPAADFITLHLAPQFVRKKKSNFHHFLSLVYLDWELFGTRSLLSKGAVSSSVRL